MNCRNTSSLSTPLRGIVPPMITPLTDRDTLDVEGLERLVEHLVTGGVHGLFILGTSGEAPALSYRVRRELIARVCRQVGGRLPVLVGVTDTAPVETLALARSAYEAGACAVVAAPPFYFPLSQAELLRYVRGLMAELPLPLVLYNMPKMTKVSFEPDTVRQLLDVPGIVGLKDSSREMDYFLAVRQITRERADWSLLVGFEHMLLDTLHAGGDGGVLAGANLSPRLFVDLYEAATAGRRARVDQIQRTLASLRRIYTVAEGVLASVAGIKCALSLRGIAADAMADPFVRLSAEQRSQVAAILDESEGVAQG
jgi:dihydrodipicolinate synthase/N-acetylneuraminate lyase